MFRYEIFRQSVIGWFLIASFLWFTFPYIDIDLTSWGNQQWIVLFVAGLISSPVFGYMINQMNRAYYLITGTRPNDTKINITHLHGEFSRIVSDLSNPDYTLTVLKGLPPKDLHRFVWVSHANKELRERSESYWERYYSNVCISIATVLGTIIALCSLLICVPLFSIDTFLKTIVIIVLLFSLGRTNKEYLRICMSIENTWIESFLAKLSKQPNDFSNGIFKIKA